MILFDKTLKTIFVPVTVLWYRKTRTFHANRILWYRNSNIFCLFVL